MAASSQRSCSGAHATTIGSLPPLVVAGLALMGFIIGLPIDTADSATVSLEVKKHVNVSTVTAGTISSNLKFCSDFLKSVEPHCNDVACDLRLRFFGTTLGEFGETDDELESIDTEAELQQVFAIPVHAKVVRFINRCGGVNGSFIGCARTPSDPPNMIIQAGATRVIWAHEFGHTRGIAGDYVGCTSLYMRKSLTGDEDSVTPGERDSFLIAVVDTVLDVPSVSAKSVGVLAFLLLGLAVAGILVASGRRRVGMGAGILMLFLCIRLLAAGIGNGSGLEEVGDALAAGRPYQPRGGVDEFLQGEYVDRVPYVEARALGKEAVPRLLDIIADASAARYHLNAIMALGFLGDPQATPHLLRYLQSPSGDVTDEQFRALRAVLQALGCLAAHGDGAALNFIREGAHIRAWGERQLRWHLPGWSDDRRNLSLTQAAIGALAVSGRDEARITFAEVPAELDETFYRKALADVIIDAQQTYLRVRMRGLASIYEQ